MHLSGQDPAKVGPGFWELYADDIGRAAVYLSSDDADYITGEILHVDGGFKME